MKRQIGFADAVGKTIAGIEEDFNYRWIISFTDDTYSMLVARMDYDGDHVINDATFDFSDAEPSALFIRLGIYTQDEYDENEGNRLICAKEDAERRQREEYERLKKIYEGK